MLVELGPCTREVFSVSEGLPLPPLMSGAFGWGTACASPGRCRPIPISERGHRSTVIDPGPLVDSVFEI